MEVRPYLADGRLRFYPLHDRVLVNQQELSLSTTRCGQKSEGKNGKIRKNEFCPYGKLKFLTNNVKEILLFQNFCCLLIKF